MKKRFAVLFLMILTCLALVIFGACGGGENTGDIGGTEPGQTEPGQTEPGQTEPGQTEPGQTEPGQTEPGQTEPGQTEPGQTETCEHEYVLDEEQSRDATCSQTGLIVRVCSICGAKQEEETPKTAHTYVADAENSKPSTCEEAGVAAEKCTVCGDIRKTELTKLSHVFETHTTQPTCTEAGKIEQTCSNCGATSVTPIPALGHTFSGPACTDRECSVCHEKTPATQAHSFVLQGTSTEQLSGDDAQIYCKGATIGNYVCEACGTAKQQILSEAVLHEVAEWHEEGELTMIPGSQCDYARTLTGECAKCGSQVEHTQTVEGKHQFVTVIDTAATCKAQGTRHQHCTVCEFDGETESYSDPDAHVWVAGGTEGNVTTFTCQNDNTHTKKSLVAAGNKLLASADDVKNADEVNLNGASIQLDATAKDSLPAGELVFGLSEADMPANAPQEVEGQPVYDITLQNGSDLVTSFKGGDVTVRLPYTLQDGEDPNLISIWYINENGELEAIKATYADGYAVFTTKHFSYYTVGLMTAEQMCETFGHAEGNLDREPTCLTGGYHVKLCTRCNVVMKNEVIPALGHNWEKNETKSTPATCTAAGREVETCSYCKKDRSVAVAPLGHEWVKDVAQSKDATCTATGKAVYTCAHDGCEETLESVVPMTPHDCDEVVTPPTCTQEGYTTFTCKDCHIVYTGAVTAPKGHTWDIPEATCTQGQTCTVCGAQGEQAKDHVWNVEEPTCSVEQECTVCGAKGKPKTAHTYENGVCTVCGDGCDHAWEKVAEKSKDATCTEEGCTTSVCPKCHTEKTEVQNVIPHAFDELTGRCTVCGAVDPERSSEYFDVIMSLRAECYTVDLSGVSFRTESGGYVTRFTIEQGKGSFSFKSGRPVFLITVAKCAVSTLSTYYDRSEDYSDILVYSDGYTIVVQYNFEGETYYMRVSMSEAANDPAMMENAILMKIMQDDEVAAYITKLFNANYMWLASLLDNGVETVFTREGDEKNYTLSLNSKGILTLSEMLTKNTVREIVEKVIGEGNFDKLVSYVKEMMTEKTAKEAIDDLLTRAQEYHIEKDELFGIINHVAELVLEELDKIEGSFVGSDVGGDYEDVGPSERPVNRRAAATAAEEQPHFDINELYGKEILTQKTFAEIMEIGNTAFAQKIDDYVEWYADAKPYEIIEAASGGHVTGEMIDAIVKAVFEKDAFGLSIRVENGAAKSITIKADGLQILNAVDQNTNIYLEGTLSFLIGEGKVELPENDRDSKLISTLKNLIAANGGKYTFHTKDDTLYGGTTYEFTLSGDKVSATVTVDRINNENIYDGTRSVYAIDDLAAAQLDVSKACGKGVYAYTYSYKWVKSSKVKVSIDGNGNITIVEKGTASGYYSGSHRDTLAFNEDTTSFVEIYEHNFVVDEARSESPDSVQCEEYYNVVEVCSRCGETREYRMRKNHDVYRRYLLVDENGTCEDGVISESYCKTCGKTLYSNQENISYEHSLYTAWETVTTSEGEFVIEYRTCACGREKEFEGISHIHDGKEYSFIRVGVVSGTTTAYVCSKDGCGVEIRITEARSASEDTCYEYITHTVTITGTQHVYRNIWSEYHEPQEKRDNYKVYSLEVDGYTGYYQMMTYTYPCGHRDNYVEISEYRKDQYGRTILEMHDRYNLENDDYSYYSLYEYRYKENSCDYDYYTSFEKGVEPQFRYRGTSHRQEPNPEYKLLGTSCEDGVEVTYHCVVCGEIASTYTTYGHSVHSFQYEVKKANGELVATVYTYACPCGEEQRSVTISRGNCSLDLYSTGEHSTNAAGHDIYIYHCAVSGCNVSVHEERWKENVNCEVRRYRIYTFYEGDTIIGDPEGYSGFDYWGTEHDCKVDEKESRDLTEQELKDDYKDHAQAHGHITVTYYDYHCDHEPDQTVTEIVKYDRFGRRFYRLKKVVLADGSLSEYYEERYTFMDTTCECYREWRHGEDREWNSELTYEHNYSHNEYVSPTCTQYGYRAEICRICGDKNIYEIDYPIGHIYENGVCRYCGLENAQEADGEVTLEDMTTAKNYVIGAWAHSESLINDFMYQTFFVFLDAEGKEQTIEYKGAEWALSYTLPGYSNSRIYTLSKATANTALAAAKQTAEGKGWTTYIGVKFLLTARFNNIPHVISIVLTNDKVTAAGWKEALSAVTNFTATVDEDGKIGTEKFDRDKAMFADENGEPYMYLAEEGGEYYRYTQQDTAWTKEAVGSWTGDLLLPLAIQEIGNRFNEFTLKEGHYMCSWVWMDIYVEGYGYASFSVAYADIVLVDGAVASMQLVLSNGWSETITLSAIGTTTVTVPTVA